LALHTGRGIGQTCSRATARTSAARTTSFLLRSGSATAWTCERSRCAPEVREVQVSRCVESVVTRSRPPPRPYAPVLCARPALRRSQAQHDPTHRAQRQPPDRRDQRRVEL